MTKVEFTEADGRQLGADLLRAIHAEWRAINDKLPEDRTDDEVAVLWQGCRSDALRQCLSAVRETGSEPLAYGLYAVLTDFIGCVLEGAVPEVSFYERETRHA